MKSSSYSIINESQLRKEYVQEKKSSEMIAREYSTSPQTIVRLMKEYKINIRSPKERQRLSIQTHGPSKLGKKTSEETKRKLSKLATGRKHSEETKVKIRLAQKNIKHSKEWNKKVSLALKGKKKSEKHKESLRRAMDNKRGKTYDEIFGKEKADEIRSKIGSKLEKNPAWKGGISFEPYSKEFNNRFKKIVRKRDNQICMLCTIHREKLSRALDIHHINYNKKLTIKENCISLCKSCHTKTNFNRVHWIKFFHSLLSERYNYNYSELNEPIININEAIVI